LLERLTNAGREKVQTDNLTVEHVLPQNPKLSKAWQEMLGSEWKAVQERCLHKLGNLTLTAFNQEFSDKPFAEKKARNPGGYAFSPVWLNESVAQEPVWGESEVTRRGAMLAKRALAVWRPLRVDATALAEAELEEQRARSSAFKVDELPWTASSRKLFILLCGELRACGEDVVELPYQKSIVYRSPEWFVEVLPRKHKLVIRLAPDPEELSDLCPDVEASDDWSFIANSLVEGGAVFTMRSEADAEMAKQLVRRAYEIVEES
jgi:predicted transport protein